MLDKFRNFRLFAEINASIMPVDHNHPVFKEYERRKNLTTLSSNLREPTPASLRNECLAVYDEKGEQTNEPALRAFLGSLNNGETYRSKIVNIDIDRFRPLVYFLKKTIKTTNNVNTELLNWLMGEENKGGIPLPPASPIPPVSPISPLPPISEKLSLWDKLSIFIRQSNFSFILLILLLGFKIIFFFWQENTLSIREPEADQKCMYWTGYHYEPISCDKTADNSIVIPLDLNRMKSMKKLPFFIKVTKRDIGRLWWGKVDGSPEYFTDSGIHPVDTTKRLLPLSAYMVAKYETEKNLIIDLLTWTYYITIGVLCGLLILLFRKRRVTS
ncbi:hypothetical protein [Pedobacter sp. BMA]|uniref:hypothetical protein n=1 Tax=Pedobacter sp. BMA TaxID=1663685 RepID=UPI00064ABA64|nr:hypothetical protein [Pedobacter sp. BMA]KLT64791.1 hypothetical protein AB669_13730 [Pedobacter sp. BMA]